MSKKIRSKVVFCEAKKRYVHIDYTGNGPWYSPDFKLEYCPAVNDPGQSCDYACLQKMNVPADYRYAGTNSE